MTSDPARLSDEKCTCVNNRCIRSKISGDNLDCRRVELSVKCDATGSRWMSNNYITRVQQEVRLVRDQSLESVFQFEEWELGPSPRPPVEESRRTGKKCCYYRKSWGSICCSLCSVSNSPLTHKAFVTLL